MEQTGHISRQDKIWEMLKKFNDLLEWLLTVIILYYFVFAGGIITLSLTGGSDLSKIKKFFLILASTGVAVIVVWLFHRLMCPRIHLLSPIKVSLIYVGSMLVLFAGMPYYVYAVLSMFEVL